MIGEKNFVVYKSSAGSGKTYTLVREYLRLALLSKDPRYFRHILAITFTNKAANEMKDRVLESLRTLSFEPSEEGFDAGYLADIMQVTKLGDVIVRKRAGAILDQMLHHYTDLGISTIDKFVHKVVRTFARDLRIPVDFDVELDSTHLLTKAIDLLVSRAGSDMELTQTMVEFSEQKARDDKSWHIEYDLFRFAQSLIREDSDQYLDVLRKMSPEQLNAVRNGIFDHVENIENKVRAFGDEGAAIIASSGVSGDLFVGGKVGVSAYFRKLSTFKDNKIADRPKAVDNAFANGKWYAGKAKKDEQNAIDAVTSELINLLTRIETYVEEIGPQYQLYKLISDHLYAMSILHELDTVIREIKTDVNVLLIADFNKTISEIVLNEPAPFIYERLGERYHHYLIDEFQDTSVMQWQNLLPLVENSLSTASFNLLVGDGKQAIYRWRSGEVEQFSSLPELYNADDSIIMQDKARALKMNYEERVLDTNYRSQKHIVEFNNGLFETMVEDLAPEYRNIYEQHKQEFLPSKSGGFVEAKLVDFKDKVSQEDAYLEEILDTINKVVQDGYRLQDIAILVRKNALGSLITQYLLERNIDVVSSESLLLKKSPEVNLIINFFELIRNPSNSIAKTAIVRYITNCLQTDVHFHIVMKEYSEEVNKEKHISTLHLFKFLKDFDYDVKLWRLTRQPIYQSVEDLIRVFSLNKEPDAYLQFFLDAVHAYSSRFGNNVVEFLEWWEKQREKLSVQIPEGTEAVNVLTIHKSKGLQFPVVIVPFVNWEIKYGKDSIWVNLHDEVEGLDVALLPVKKDVENTAYAHLYFEEKNKSFLDNMNMLYVAFTRPEERLYILTESTTTRNNIAITFTSALVQQKGWLPGENLYRSGRPTPPAFRDKSGPNIYHLRNMPSGNWRDKLAISLQAPRVWDEEESDQKSIRALIVSALSKIKKADEIPTVLTSLYDEGLLNTDEQKEVGEKLQRLSQLNGSISLFNENSEVRLGADILGEGGRSYRPDRLMVKEKTANIIQYVKERDIQTKQKESSEIAGALLQMGFDSVKSYGLDIDNEVFIEL